MIPRSRVEAVVAATEKAHEDSMSGDATRAAYGRLLKRVIPGLDDWIHDEICRLVKSRSSDGKDMSAVLYAACDVAVSIIGSVGLTLTQGDGYPKDIADHISSVVAKKITHVLTDGE